MLGIHSVGPWLRIANHLHVLSLSFLQAQYKLGKNGENSWNEHMSKACRGRRVQDTVGW